MNQFIQCRNSYFFDKQAAGTKWTRCLLPKCGENGKEWQLIIDTGIQQQQAIFSLQGVFLFWHQEDHAYCINLENGLIEGTNSQIHGFGIKLTIQDVSVVLFGNCRELLGRLKNFMIQTNFHSIYRLQCKIGKGTFADVYKAVNVISQRCYAVKCFVKCKLAKHDTISIMKEIKILRHLKTDKVIQMHEVFENEEYIFVVLDLLVGGDLTRTMKSQSLLPEQDIMMIIKQLLKGVAYIHAQGVMHRDLKPQNILLRHSCSYDDICITDFGLADYYNKLGIYQHPRCGTPGYLAPEILQDKQYNYKVDIYSIGAIMYELLTGKPPFHSGDYDTIVSKNYTGQINYQGIKVSNSGLDLLQGLLEYNPRLRLNAKLALTHDWFNYTDSRMILNTLPDIQLPGTYFLKCNIPRRLTTKLNSLTLSPLSNRAPSYHQRNSEQNSPLNSVFSSNRTQAGRVTKKSIFVKY